MRVIDPSPNSATVRARRAPVRATNIELLGLLACSAAVLFGLALTYWGRTSRLFEDGQDPATLVPLTTIATPDPLEPLLPMFEEPFERKAVARRLHDRAVAGGIEHVGALAAVTIPAAEVRQDPRLVALGARLARRPSLVEVPVLSPADLAAIKPRLAVRTSEQYRRAFLAAAGLFVAAFWAAHLFRRWRRADDDPLLLPLLLILCGLGLMSMTALRDPLRDTMIFSAFAVGTVAGLAVLLAASEIDFEASRLRRAVLAPLGAAFGLAILLLLFGSGPGTSGAKVNLSGFQPVEAIRLLVILALAAYFARRLDFLREMNEKPPAWLRWLRLPRARDIQPIAASMTLVLLFFFLQKDLGPALVMSCVFLGLYGLARGRSAFVAFGFGMLAAGFGLAYLLGFPGTVMQRVMIWLDPWNNGVPGGNQIAHGLWALASGGLFGLGQGLGSPQVIPAGHTDFVLAAVGEELGLAGILSIVALYGLLCWRCVRTSLRAPGDYTAFLAAGLALALIVQTLIIAGGLLGLVPLSGVVTPFLSYGKSSMLANFAAVGIVMAIARRRGPVRLHLQQPVRVLSVVMATAGLAVVGRAVWVQVPRADAYATAASAGEQADGGYRFEYNPRVLAAARLLPRGTVYDRNGLPIATSRPEEIATIAALYRKVGVETGEACKPDSGRCYPLGGPGFHVLGDWRSQVNWGARNSSYVERDRASVLQGFDDHPTVVDIVNPRTGARERAVRRDYSELLPLVRHRYQPWRPSVRALLERSHDVRTSLDARLQLRAAAALKARIDGTKNNSGSAVVLDADTGDVLASVSYPWPSSEDLARRDWMGTAPDLHERVLDRSRYGLYPPGSIFKLVVAGAALTRGTDATFACVRLPDGRVGNFLRGSKRPVRDDLLDTRPHGQVNLHEGIVHSCNAYFAQLAQQLGPRAIVDAASLFQIDAARVSTAAGLQPTLPHAGYGQGEVVVSPIKMARVAAAVAAGGVVRPARWDAGSALQQAEPRFLSASAAARLGRDMRAVVTEGTGKVLASNRTAIAGKTGTAEVGDGPAHSWFVGFAPYDAQARRIAFSVIVENAGYGARSAAPVAGEIVTAARELGLFR